jgi:Asp/Glu/hydantoin racemase
MPGDQFTTLSAAFGPELIVTDEDTSHAVEGVKATVEAHGQACDGIVLASFGDTGAREVRSMRPGLPVLGIASAAFLAAKALGGRFGIVTFGESVARPLERTVEEMALVESLAGIAYVEGGDRGDPGTVQTRLQTELERRCHDLVGEGATSIVLGGGPLAGLASVLRVSVPVPVIDGTQAAIGLMRAFAPRRSHSSATLDPHVS